MLSYGPWYQINVEFYVGIDTQCSKNILVCSFKTFLRSSFCSRVEWLSWLITSSTSTFSYLAPKISVAWHVWLYQSIPKSSSTCWQLVQTPYFQVGEDCAMATHCWTIPWSLYCIWHKFLFLSKISTQNDILFASLWLKYECLLLVNSSVFVKLR